MTVSYLMCIAVKLGLATRRWPQSEFTQFAQAGAPGAPRAKLRVHRLGAALAVPSTASAEGVSCNLAHFIQQHGHLQRPTRSQFRPPSGAYVLRPAGPDRDAVPVYCDMTRQAGASRESSGPIFIRRTPSGTIAFVGSKLCTMTWNNDDMDSTMMWVTLEGKIKRDNGYDTTGRTYFTFSRDLMTATGMQSQWADYIWAGDADRYRPSGTLNGCAKPIPFPGSGYTNGTVVWLQNDALKFKAAGTDYSIPWASTGIPQTCYSDLSTCSNNVYVFVTDGISSFSIGRRNGWNMRCYFTVQIDWTAPTYDSSMLNVTVVRSSNSWWSTSTSTIGSPAHWHGTEQDSMAGDLLWTVKGKPAYITQNRMHLGTSLARPFVSTLSTALPFPNTYPAGNQGGLDFFIRVDTSGALWLGDWGHDNGGLFNCGNDNNLGTQATTIQLVPIATANDYAAFPSPPAPPPVPPSLPPAPPPGGPSPKPPPSPATSATGATRAAATAALHPTDGGGCHQLGLGCYRLLRPPTAAQPTPSLTVRSTYSPSLAFSVRR